MINRNELLFTVDENNNPITPVPRHVAHSTGIWHRNAHIWVYNSKKQILVHQRSKLKDSAPGKWEAFLGGHIPAGVDSIDGAIQELKEEVGLSALKTDLEFVSLCKGGDFHNKEFIYVYTYKWDGDIRDINFEKEEIEQLAWFELELLEEEIISNKEKRWTRPKYIKEVVNHIRSKYSN